VVLDIVFALLLGIALIFALELAERAGLGSDESSAEVSSAEVSSDSE
jgi:hypothetical protein